MNTNPSDGSNIDIPQRTENQTVNLVVLSRDTSYGISGLFVKSSSKVWCCFALSWAENAHLALWNTEARGTVNDMSK